MARQAKKSDKPDILVIWGDDIGIANLSCYSHGSMGYQTPNIDRVAREGIPYERSDITSNTYYDWMLHNAYFLYAAQAAAGMFAATFKDFPPAQRPGTFTVDQALAKMHEVPSGD